MAATKYLTVPHLDRKTLARIFRDITVNDRGCWIWNGSRDKDGYGQVNLSCLPNTITLHRLMFAWLVGPLPCGYARDIPVIDHIVCDTPPCCNPAHLRLVSQRENLSRSNAISSINRAKTHCPRGHLLPAPKRYTQGLMRHCRTCVNARNHERRVEAVRLGLKKPFGALRTHCKIGHLLTVGRNGWKDCIECGRTRARENARKRRGGITHPTKGRPRLDGVPTVRTKLVDQPSEG